MARRSVSAWAGSGSVAAIRRPPRVTISRSWPSAVAELGEQRVDLALQRGAVELELDRRGRALAAGRGGRRARTAARRRGGSPRRRRRRGRARRPCSGTTPRRSAEIRPVDAGQLCEGVRHRRGEAISDALRRQLPGPGRRRRTSWRCRSGRRGGAARGRGCVARRAPEQPSGWPRAIAPPLTLSVSSSMPSSRAQARTWEAKASFSSIRSISSRERPAAARARGTAIAGPMPM